LKVCLIFFEKMKRIILLSVFLQFFLFNARSQSMFTNLDVHLYLGGIQNGSPGFTIGYEHLKPKELIGGSFTYVIPFLFSQEVDLWPLSEDTRPATTYVSYQIKPKDIRLSFKKPIKKDTRDKWFLYWYADVNFNITNVVRTVTEFNHNKYDGPSNMTDSYISYFIGLGMGFERRFGEMAVYGFPAINVAATNANMGSYTVDLDSSMPTFITMTFGFKKYFAEDFKKKFGAPKKTRKKRR